jgi:hypothetical protein
MNWIKVGWCGLALFACKTQEKSLSQTQLGERAYEQYLQKQAQSWEGKNLSQHRFKPPKKTSKNY